MDQLDSSAVKIIEIMGVSTDGFEDALRQAVDKAAVSVNGITSVEVVRQTASVREGVVVRYDVEKTRKLIHATSGPRQLARRPPVGRTLGLRPQAAGSSKYET